MSDFLDGINSNLLRLIEIIVIAGTIIWAAAFLRADIERNKEWNNRQDAEHQEFMRRDVGDQQFQAIRDQLNRIEKKINNN